MRQQDRAPGGSGTLTAVGVATYAAPGTMSGAGALTGGAVIGVTNPAPLTHMGSLNGAVFPRALLLRDALWAGRPRGIGPAHHRRARQHHTFSAGRH